MKKFPMKNNLKIAIPNKGRLEQDTQKIFSSHNMEIIRDKGDRDYRGKILEIAGVDIVFLSPKEITLELLKGSIDLGITGLDLVHENIYDTENNVALAHNLGFGFADIVIAVPVSWIDVISLEDLEDVIYDFRLTNKKRLRIATKYPKISREFFVNKGFSDYILVDSHGATEGAPAYGASEIIIDITSTGSTLKANQLKRLDSGTILKSQACIFASFNSAWNKSKLDMLEEILGLLEVSKDSVANIQSKILSFQKKPL
ncbi:MAG: ATP phosphoribosyltransferase [Rhodobiaceae bacterium]|nr:ATP phosphoribosyltransferase [Rhodobiaceae bacterium]|tara:strand:+ start:10854 stop:11627 length:774 start_codon:yes stop_codon:yes gene_type:complete